MKVKEESEKAGLKLSIHPRHTHTHLTPQMRSLPQHTHTHTHTHLAPQTQSLPRHTHTEAQGTTEHSPDTHTHT